MFSPTARLPLAGHRPLALAYGAACHTLFVMAIASSWWAMYHGMHWGPVSLSGPWALLWDSLLLVQFPVVHSFLLTRRGGRQLQRLAPKKVAAALCTTTFTIVASLQMLILFTLWAPLGKIWWAAQGTLKIAVSALYLSSWIFLGKAMADAGLATQTGFLGWFAVYRGQKPEYEPMPQSGLFRWCRQPIYLAFALTTWTVPVWTPDQLLVAFWFTGYCLLGPIFKERRYQRRYGEAFRHYQSRVPYFVPSFSANPGHTPGET